MVQILGTDASDTLAGAASADSFLAGGGDDVVRGFGGDDSIYGGDGADVASGDDGSDRVYGDAGDDLLTGAYPYDFVSDQLYGGEGNDSIQVGMRDEAHGGVGSDLFELFSDQDYAGSSTNIFGDDGIDGANLEPAGVYLTVHLDPQQSAGGVNIYDVELVLLGDFGSKVYGGDHVDAVIGGAGGDDVQGAGGDDILAGLDGGDTLSGGDGDDILDGGYGDDRLDGGAGFDTADYSAASQGIVIDLGRTDAQNTGFGSDRLSSIEEIVGTNYDDRIAGSSGDDVLVASSGGDRYDGGGGADMLILAGFAHDYALAVKGGAGRVTGGPESGVDILTSVETLKLLDGELTVDTGSTAAQILRLYDSFLGRAPDVAGFNSYLNFAASGHSFQDMAAAATASPEFHDATAGLSDADYITYVYAHSLHRAPDAYGMQQYLDALHSGALTRTSMIVQAAESPEHVALTAGVVAAGLWVPDAHVEGLELLYDAAVRRQPDALGLSEYGKALTAGTTFKEIANQMASSPEFQAAHAGQNDAQYVDSLYVAEVGRHADPYGLSIYTAELAAGHTRGDILYETAMSQEHQSHVLAFYDPLLVGA